MSRQRRKPSVSYTAFGAGKPAELDDERRRTLRNSADGEAPITEIPEEIIAQSRLPSAAPSSPRRRRAKPDPVRTAWPESTTEIPKEIIAQSRLPSAAPSSPRRRRAKSDPVRTAWPESTTEIPEEIVAQSRLPSAAPSSPRRRRAKSGPARAAWPESTTEIPEEIVAQSRLPSAAQPKPVPAKKPLRLSSTHWESMYPVIPIAPMPTNFPEYSDDAPDYAQLARQQREAEKECKTWEFRLISLGNELDSCLDECGKSAFLADCRSVMLAYQASPDDYERVYDQWNYYTYHPMKGSERNP